MSLWISRDRGPVYMGVGRIFSRSARRGFSQFFPGGPKVVKFDFYPSKLKKQPFLPIISKSWGGLAPCLYIPVPMPVYTSDFRTPILFLSLFQHRTFNTNRKLRVTSAIYSNT